VILALNRPDTDPDAHCNDELRDTLTATATVDPDLPGGAHSTLHSLAESSDILVVERPQPLPAREGVGLARKLGCDIALALKSAGRIRSRWLHNSDADAILPTNYFDAAERQGKECAAIVHPFLHEPRTVPVSLYELRMHYYVLGLRYAGSPYAFHTLGSCLSVDFDAYQQVRGFPRRSGAEDFYLLNKVAKLGAIGTPVAPVIHLEGRVSGRVPFGTGPALKNLSDCARPLEEALFYHPDSFHALKTVLATVPGLYQAEKASHHLAGALRDYPLAMKVLEQLGIEKCLRHCREQSNSREAFLRHFSHWFDGFRTLKFIHGMREQGWQDLTLKQSLDHPNNIWPQACPGSGDPLELLHSCLDYFGWESE
jgi:hypothetical protein